MGMNSKSLGICFAGHGDYHPWTPDQRGAGIGLIQRLMEKYSIPITGVLGHRETGARKTCPGKLIDMDKVREMVQGSSAPTAVPGHDYTGMFASLCAIFDDPEFRHLPNPTQVAIKQVREMPPFGDMTREDLG